MIPLTAWPRMLATATVAFACMCFIGSAMRAEENASTTFRCSAAREDAAGQFATYIMLQFGDDRAHRLIFGTAFSYGEFGKNYQQRPNVSLPLLAFSSDYGSPEQRFYNLLCLAYGYDDKLFRDVIEKEYLPQAWARNCRYEYGMLRYAFRQLIVPHVDMDLAKHVKQVMASRWLDGSESRRQALR